MLPKILLVEIISLKRKQPVTAWPSAGFQQTHPTPLRALLLNFAFSCRVSPASPSTPSPGKGSGPACLACVCHCWEQSLLLRSRARRPRASRSSVPPILARHMISPKGQLLSGTVSPSRSFADKPATKPPLLRQKSFALPSRAFLL